MPNNKDGILLPASPTRIISFAPNITEILYELGLNDKIQGVTRFCKYPPEAAGKDKIGGHTDFNYEMVLRLKPDLAVILKEQQELVSFFDGYGIRYITIGSDSVDEIIESVRAIADACSVKDRGEALAQKLRLSLERVRLSSPAVAESDADSGGYYSLIPTVDGDIHAYVPVPADMIRPDVLLCVGRDGIGSGVVTKCYAAGALSFYHQLIEAAGGINILANVKQAYPAIGAEAIIRLNPDIIIDISSAYSARPQQEICEDWNVFRSVAAVKAANVHCLTGDYLTIPGPRFVLILERFRGIFGIYE